MAQKQSRINKWYQCNDAPRPLNIPSAIWSQKYTTKTWFGVAKCPRPTMVSTYIQTTFSATNRSGYNGMRLLRHYLITRTSPWKRRWLWEKRPQSLAVVFPSQTAIVQNWPINRKPFSLTLHSSIRHVHWKSGQGAVRDNTHTHHCLTAN